ncbi:hypothetical protein EVAR_13193_1 [Eumeta japonica]|uniref:Mariner Mos1 transposase n=1 Tax=Eumeta variegata TaxID=151549 RepID=A0A4C1TS45_EUMVA|nr:hypothetical protein EVAR_13193_1 [Eumeta japonica]
MHWTDGLMWEPRNESFNLMNQSHAVADPGGHAIHDPRAGSLGLKFKLNWSRSLLNLVCVTHVGFVLALITICLFVCHSPLSPNLLGETTKLESVRTRNLRLRIRWSKNGLAYFNKDERAVKMIPPRASCDAEELQISKERVGEIIHELMNMRKSVRIGTKMLTLFDKQRRLQTNETWIRQYDPESKQESMQWTKKGERPPKKFKVQKSASKLMATIFWDSEDVLLINYLPKGTTMNGQYYTNLLAQAREAVVQKRRGKLSRGVLFYKTMHLSTRRGFEAGPEGHGLFGN